MCQETGATVVVVGPPAVLGSDLATEPFVDSVMGETHQLPVTRGPDSALLERLELGYWFLTQPPDDTLSYDHGFRFSELPAWVGAGNREFAEHRCIAATEVQLPVWYGGDNLAGLVSGCGPYALTRLSQETGGRYILFADDAHRGPFRLDALQAYCPDYRSIDEVAQDIDAHPLRQAVMEAAKATHGKQLGAPPTMLFGAYSQTPPYGFMRSYLTPVDFVKQLRARGPKLKEQTCQTLDIVEDALAKVSEPGNLEVGLDKEYEGESSPRWRAWYDLTRGRLLATSVRLAEYRKICDLLMERGATEPTTNFVVLVPSQQLRTGSTDRRLVTSYRSDVANPPSVGHQKLTRNSRSLPMTLSAAFRTHECQFFGRGNGATSC
jgi:hypothetical protein